MCTHLFLAMLYSVPLVFLFCCETLSCLLLFFAASLFVGSGPKCLSLSFEKEIFFTLSLQRHLLLPAAMVLLYFDFSSFSPRVVFLQSQKGFDQPLAIFSPLLHTSGCLPLLSFSIITAQLFSSVSSPVQLSVNLTYMKENDRSWPSSARMNLLLSLSIF